MYNYKLTKIDPISTLKYSLLLSVSISIIILALNILLLIIRIISTLFTNSHILTVLAQGGIQIFFTIIVLMLSSVSLGFIGMFLSIVYNYSSKWFDGIKVHVDEYVEVQTEEKVESVKDSK